MKYRAEIDGLRAFSVIPVIFFHAGYGLFGGGFAGVDVFFVISGYLITTILVEDLVNNRFSVVGFYERRVRRILPALYSVVLASTFFAVFLLWPSDLTQFGKSVFSIPFFASNFFFWSERGYFDSAAELKPLLHTWSLAVEEQFYIVYPLLLFALYRMFAKVFYVALFGAFCLSLIFSYYVTRLHFDTAFFLPFARAWELIIGCFIALLYINRGDVLKNAAVSDVAGFLGLGLIVYAYVGFDQSTPFPSVYALVPTIGAGLVIIGSKNGALCKGLLSAPILVATGLISYSLYLVHQPVFAFARAVFLFEGLEPFYIAVSFILAGASYYLVERPFRARGVIPAKTVWRLALVFSFVLCAFGALIVYYQGFPGRYSVSDQKILRQFVDYKAYNQALFDRLEFAPFSGGEDKKKVLLIGDSHAKDFVNILSQSRVWESLSLSTRQLNAECGNLYIDDYSRIEAFIPAARRERCRVLGRYDGEIFQKLLKEADEIWLVSAWSSWVIPFLPESLDNLKQDFGKTVRVFGRKHFGVVNQGKALRIQPQDRLDYTQSVSKDADQIEIQMGAALLGYAHYYPVMDVFCGGDRAACQIFDPDGYLISADGGHLTKEGADELARRLDSLLQKIVK